MKQAQLPRKIPTQARSRMMVETILKTTATVVVKHGYAGTNTNLVAQRAGVSVGSVYQYFPNKDALIAALYERHAQSVNRVILDVAGQYEVSDLQAHIKLLVRALLQLHLQNRSCIVCSTRISPSSATNPASISTKRASPSRSSACCNAGATSWPTPTCSRPPG